MRGVRDRGLCVRAGLALALCGAMACGVVDVKRPGPPPPCPSETPAPILPPPAPPPAVPSATPSKSAPLSLRPVLAPSSRPVSSAQTEAPSSRSAPSALAQAPAPPRSAASTKAAPSPADPACPDDMVKLPSFCIDRYEAPNVAGERPFSLRTAGDGEQWCGAHGKRLCTEGEWRRACEGPSGWRYPYGDEHRASACNDERPWIPVNWKALARWPAVEAIAEAERLFQAEASGARPGCVSEEGVYDLTGNVAEWVLRDDPAPRPGYEHVLKGCYWAGCYHEPQPNCVFRNSAHPGSFRTYEAGFRCCRKLDTSSASASETN
jgi:hypothetical protein